MEPLHNLLRPLLGLNESLLFDPLYDQIRYARKEDDDTLSQGIWTTEIKRSHWEEVEKLCCYVLQERSKDLQIAVWLWEAWIHLYQWQGFEQGLLLLLKLIETFELHPHNALHQKNILEWADQAIAKHLSYVKFSNELQKDSKKFDKAYVVIASLTQQYNWTFPKISYALDSLQKSLEIERHSFNETNVQEDKPFSSCISNEDQEKPILMNEEIAFDAIQQIAEYLKHENVYSFIPYLLEVAIAWRNKNIIQILENIKTSNLEGHRIMKFLYQNDGKI